MDNRNINKEASFLQGFVPNFQGGVDQIRLHLEQLKEHLELEISQNMRSGKDQYVANLKSRWLEVEHIGHQVTSSLAVLNSKPSTSWNNSNKVNVSDIFKNINKQFFLRSQSTDSINWSCFPIGDVDKVVFIDQQLMSAAIIDVINIAFNMTFKGFVKTTFWVENNKIIVEVCNSGKGLTRKEVDILLSKSIRSPDTLISGVDRIQEEFSEVIDLVEMAEGSITIESALGLGTKVVLRFPFDAKSLEDKKKGSGSIGLKPTYTQNRVEDGLRVLVVDSDLHNIQRLEALLSKQMLRRNDVQVTVCQALSDAICEIEETSYDLLLIGYYLPGINGFDFLKHIDTSENMCKGAVKVIMNADFNFKECINSKTLSLSDVTMTNSISIKEVINIVRRLTIRLV